MGRAYYITQQGELRREGNTLIFQNSEVKKSLPVEDLEELFLVDECSLSSKALGLLSKMGVVTHFFNHHGYYIGSFYPRETHISGYLLVKQVEHYLHKDKRLYLAKSFVEGAIRNLCPLFGGNTEVYVSWLDKVESLPEVMKVEAQLRKDFYESLESITGWSFEKRSKRPPHNPLNALISFGNSLIYAKVLGEIYVTQLNPTVSYLHEPSTKRFSLSLDVAEIFKPILSDRLILELLRSSKLKEEHFLSDLEYAYLSPEGRKVFLAEFNQLLESTIFHPRLRRKVSHKQMIRLELYKLIKHLIEEEPYRPLIYWSL